ncbi:hypothetical protein B0T24DRAFT_632666, partial [Lasiosphaeria ovina]
SQSAQGVDPSFADRDKSTWAVFPSDTVHVGRKIDPPPILRVPKTLKYADGTKHTECCVIVFLVDGNNNYGALDGAMAHSEKTVKYSPNPSEDFKVRYFSFKNLKINTPGYWELGFSIMGNTEEGVECLETFRLPITSVPSTEAIAARSLSPSEQNILG